MDIYIVITEDRHASSTEAVPFADEGQAIAFAEQEVADNARHPELADEWDRDLNDAMRASGWVWFCAYGVEGDKVYVIRRELRGFR
jgi:hypothetical protein